MAKSAAIHKIALGRWGETVAAQYLEQAGYQIIARNLRSQLGELDVIARGPDQPGSLVFVEVKTRCGTRYGLGREAITAEKQRHLIRAAQLYLQQHHLLTHPWQIDVVEIQTDAAGELLSIAHLVNVVGG